MLLTIGAFDVRVLCWLCICTGTREPTCRRAGSLSNTITCGADKTFSSVTEERALSTSRTPLARTKPGKLLASDTACPATVPAAPAGKAVVRVLHGREAVSQPEPSTRAKVGTEEDRVSEFK